MSATTAAPQQAGWPDETAPERPAAASGQHDPFAVGQDAALAALELTWSDAGYHAFSSAGGGPWCAVSSAGEVLTGGTPDELDRAIRAHWEAMQ
jgi:hypothetical protein